MTPELRRTDKAMMDKGYAYRVVPQDQKKTPWTPMYAKTMVDVAAIHRDYNTIRFVDFKLEPTILLHQFIFLADNEWGSELMEKVAKERLTQMKDEYPGDICIVTVYEHAGWFLSYAFIDGYSDNMRVVGTANDGARFDGPVDAFRQKYWPARHTSLPEIRREVSNETVVA